MIQPGSTLGHYEIVSELGRGGMGEVYRARDTKLGREVAIKVLPAEFSRDEERLARMEREARMLAALNHPNIAAIYGLDQSDDTRFLVLELVEGDTLADKLKTGPIQVADSLKLALQIAEALEAAHEKGVIHRDLKPANIKVTPQGRVKVLDFGLAKAFEGAAGDVNLSNSPTLSLQATQAGIILGTAAYMSPEQARGQTADTRSDVWAFGCILYEMLTGRSPFAGEDVSLTLARVLERTADYSILPPKLQPRVRFLLERCLEKNPRDRCQGIAEARVEILKAQSDPAEGHLSGVSQPASVGVGTKLAWIAAIVVALGVGGAAVWALTPAEPRPVTRWDHPLPDGRQFLGGGRPLIAVSHDGRQFVYSAVDGLYLRSMDEMEARLISGTELPRTNPTFSPDGQWLAFWSITDGQLKKIATVGGTAVPLAPVASNPFGTSWETDGTILYSVPGDGVLRVSADGGEPQVVVPPGEDAFGGWPQLLPGGGAVLTSTLGGDVAVYSIDSGESKPLFPGSGGRFVPTGHILYAEGDALFAVPFDVDRLAVTGGAVPLVEGIQPLGVPQYSVSDNGTLIYLPGSGASQTSNTVLAWVDRDGTRTELPVEPRAYRDPKISPDGTRIAVQTTDSEGSDIWVYDIDGQTQMVRMLGEGNNTRPIWTPDGERLTFSSDRDGTQRIWWRAADLSGTATPLTPSEPGVSHNVDTWSPDGRTLSYSTSTSPRSIWTVTLDEDGAPGEPELFVGGTPEEDAFNATFSPDGEWMVYLSQPRIGEEQIYIEPFPKNVRLEISVDPEWRIEPPLEA